PMDDAKPRHLGGSLPVPNVQDLAARRDELTLTPTLLDRLPRRHPGLARRRPQAAARRRGEERGGGGARVWGPRVALAGATRGEGLFSYHRELGLLPGGEPRDTRGDRGGDEEERHGILRAPAGGEGGPRAGARRDRGVWPGVRRLGGADAGLGRHVLPPHAAAQLPRDLRLWPSNPPTSKNCLENYSAEVQRVAGELLRAMAENLGARDHSDMTRLAASQAVRMNYCPPCPEAHVDRLLGLSPHSDAVALTLLLQVSPVPGLQIRRNGGWVPVMPLPGALVVNVGDVVEVLTNGKYKSVEHRAVVNAREQRMSTAAFHGAKFGGTYGPLKEVVKEEEARYRSVSVEEYTKLMLSSKLDGKNIIIVPKVN
uniref:Fe2OG dioxygenase domain-containing protein n=1 Tax=Aegilops tauschii subsp. strangulata TaxID=200361 RepID=A0A453DPR4_AEGTS